VTISIYSLTSVDIQRGLDDFSLDAGLTYLDNEPLANVRTIPLYHERYLLFTPAGSPLADSETVSWGEVTGLPLCLLTPDMQNRRIVDGLFAAAGATVHPTIETNSVLTLWSHVRTGAYSSILSQAFLFLFGEPVGIRAIPITGSVATHSIGLVVSDHEPLTPSARALAAVAATLDLTAALDRVRREADGVPH
jgi:DNA-binding transcriptional LysR family regulator